MNHPEYIVLWPHMPTNPCKAFAVVSVQEWLAITLGEKRDYENISEHADYTTAASQCEKRNQNPREVTTLASKSGISLARAKASTSPVNF